MTAHKYLTQSGLAPAATVSNRRRNLQRWMMQFLPDWYAKFVKRVFLAFGLYVVGTAVVGLLKDLKDRKELSR